MKKVYTLIIAAILVVSFTACSNNSIDNIQSGDKDSAPPVKNELSNGNEQTTQPHPPEPSSAPTERLGFLGGNIGAGGLVCAGDDGYIYYRSESEGWRLYRALPDGSNKTKVSDRYASCINVLDGWVYFLDYPEDFPIYKVRTDGTEEIKLVDGYCSNLYVAESGIYFDKRDENNVPYIYRADLDGSNLTMLFPEEASLMYYFKGRIYLGAGQLGVLDIDTSEEKILADTYIYNVTVDGTGIYFWAVDNGEFHRMDLDGSNDSIIVRGGDFFNYAGGNLYYMGISENANGPCHVINRLNVETGENVTLYEELNEYFDAHGNLVGVTFRQFDYGDYDHDLFEYNDQGEQVLKGGGSYYNETVGYVYVAGQYLFMRAALRESLVAKGEFDCIAWLTDGMAIWD